MKRRRKYSPDALVFYLFGNYKRTYFYFCATCNVGKSDFLLSVELCVLVVNNHKSALGVFVCENILLDVSGHFFAVAGLISFAIAFADALTAAVAGAIIILVCDFIA